MKSLEEPWAILGDFNTPADTWITDKDEITVEPRDVPTAPTNSPAWPIDYCIAGSGVTTTAEVLDAKDQTTWRSWCQRTSAAQRLNQTSSTAAGIADGSSATTAAET